MGGTGIAYHNDSIPVFFVNLKNPAAYAFSFIPFQDTSGKGGIKMASFETGIVENIISLTTQGQTAKSNNTYLGYIAFNIPVSKRFGLGMGLTPLSTEGYNISTTTLVNNIDVENQYQGIGGINKVFIGAGYTPCKWLAFGTNLSYLFGNLTNVENIYYPPNIAGFNTLKLENVSVHSFYADFGAMENFTFIKNKKHPEKNIYLSFGQTYAPPINLNAGYTDFAGSQYSYGGTSYNMDTVIDTSYNGKLKMPAKYGLGITVKYGDKLTISFDYTLEKWSNFTEFGQSENLGDSKQYGFGAQYLPKKSFPRTFFQGIDYRIGASYGINYLDLNDTRIVDKNITAGIGIPIGRPNPYLSPSVLNVGIKIGTLGTTSNNLIQQNYVKLMVSFTFDDHWFDKHKFQ